MGCFILRLLLNMFHTSGVGKFGFEAFATWLDQDSSICIVLWTTQELEHASMACSILRLPSKMFSHQRSDTSTFTASQTCLNRVSLLWILLSTTQELEHASLGGSILRLPLNRFTHRDRKLRLLKLSKPVRIRFHLLGSRFGPLDS